MNWVVMGNGVLWTNGEAYEFYSCLIIKRVVGFGQSQTSLVNGLIRLGFYQIRLNNIKINDS